MKKQKSSAKYAKYAKVEIGRFARSLAVALLCVGGCFAVALSSSCSTVPAPVPDPGFVDPLPLPIPEPSTNYVLLAEVLP